MSFHHHTHTRNEVQTEGMTIRWARFYDTVVKVMTLGQDRALRQTTVNMAGLKSGDTVLDVGCGTGDLTLAASRETGPTGRVYGIDAAAEMIDVARRKAARMGANIIFQVEAIERLSFPDQTFDVVLSSLMMHHLPGDLKLRGLKEIYRVLKPGGRLFIVDGIQPTPSAPWLMKLMMSHMIHGSGAEMFPELLRQTGFTEIKSGEIHFGVIGFVSGHTPMTKPQ